MAELLRETVARFCSDEFPRGCLVVLAALTGTPESEAVRDALSAERGESIRLFRERMRRGIADGDLAADTDVEELATFYATVLFGLSVQAKDRVPCERLLAVVERRCALALSGSHQAAAAAQPFQQQGGRPPACNGRGVSR